MPEYGNPGLGYDVVPIDPSGIEIIVSVVKYGGLKERPVLNTCKIPLIDNPSPVNNDSDISDLSLKVINAITSDKLKIEVSVPNGEQGTINVYDLFGKICNSFSVPLNCKKQQFNFDINNKNQGMYIISLQTRYSKIIDKFIIIK